MTTPFARKNLSVAPLLCLLSCAVFPSPASAEGFSSRRDADGHLYYFRGQGQVIVLGSMAEFADDFGGLELQVNFSFFSIGAAVGFGYTQIRVPPEKGGARYRGGTFHMALQWRPLQLISPRAGYRYVDIHGDLGLISGGLRGDGESKSRVAFYTGGSLDVAIPLKKFRTARTKSELEKGVPEITWLMLVITGQYRYMLKQLPGRAARHELLVGIGIRSVM